VTRRAPWHVRRFRHAAVVPLEVWQLLLQGTPAYRRVGLTAVEALRRDRVEPDEIARRLVADLFRLVDAIRATNDPGLELTRDFEVLALAGGLTVLPGFRHACARKNNWHPIEILPGGPFAAIPGGAKLLQELELASSNTLVADVGQAGVKLGWTGSRGERLLVERPLESIPRVVTEEADSLLPEARESLALRSIDFVAACLFEGLRTHPEPSPRLVLALPCELDDQVRPGGCTYAGWDGRASLVLEILESLGDRLRQVPEHPWHRAERIDVLVMNDAELAGQAMLEIQGRERRKTLLLTLGFGPGGACILGGAGHDPRSGVLVG
jgi:hypothetical protein